jgi:hypothetical protein
MRSVETDNTYRVAIGLTVCRAGIPFYIKRLAGGVASQDRTLLRVEFPDKQGICREFLRNRGDFEVWQGEVLKLLEKGLGCTLA